MIPSSPRGKSGDRPPNALTETETETKMRTEARIKTKTETETKTGLRASPESTPLAADPSVDICPRVVYAENKLRLWHYDRETDGPPVVFVYAFINRPYVLDLEPDRSVVGQFLDHGFDVYLLDWGEPSLLDTHLGFYDFVERYLDNCVDVVEDRTGRIPHVFGYCTGATLAAIYAALHPDRVRTLGLLAPVLDFDVDGGVFRVWGREGVYDPETVVDTYGNTPGRRLAFEFSLVEPVEYNLSRYLRLLDEGDDAEYVDRALRRIRWGSDSVDVAGELYREFLVDLCRENRLVEGRLSIGDQRVDLANVTMPVLNVVGTDDQFVPPEASLSFVDAVSSTDTRVIEFPTDHVGLSTGERAHADLWPTVCEWFLARSDDDLAGEDGHDDGT